MNQVQCRDRITVPNLTATELIARAKKLLKLTYLYEAYMAHDFLHDHRGKTFDVLAWKPWFRGATCVDVRTHFNERGFDGNAAAFVAWVTENKPKGDWASVIPDSSRFFDLNDHSGPGGGVPFFTWDDRRYRSRTRVLSFDCNGGAMGNRYTYLGFREVK